MSSSAETRDSLLVALESFSKKERNGTLTKALSHGFLWGLEQAVRNGVIPEKTQRSPVHSTAYMRSVLQPHRSRKAEIRSAPPPPKHELATAKAPKKGTGRSKDKPKLPQAASQSTPRFRPSPPCAKSLQKATRTNTRRISDAALIDLLTGTTTRIEKVKIDEQPSACDRSVDDFYYDVDFRMTLDRFTFQCLLPHIPNLQPFAYASKIPQDLIDQLKNIPRFYLTPADNLSPRQVFHAVWCRHHQRIERYVVYWNITACISFERPAFEEWQQILSTDRKERSHLRHIRTWEQPYHSTPEWANENSSRKPCCNCYI